MSISTRSSSGRPRKASVPVARSAFALRDAAPLLSGALIQLRLVPGCDLSAKSGAYRLLILGSGRGRLAGAKHRPYLAAHVDQMKAASREFADGYGVPGVNRRESMRLHVSDFVKVSEFEMLHRVLHRPRGIERVPPWPAQSLAHYAATHHEMLPCTNCNPRRLRWRWAAPLSAARRRSPALISRLRADVRSGARESALRSRQSARSP
jgi:hypothetical protein